MNEFDDLLARIRGCSICEKDLPLGPRPVVRLHPDATLMIIGQAPGTRVHASGIPWDDQSGKNLRRWLDMTPEEFYDVRKVAIMPMGFCYPGRGKSGDLPPRSECAPQWHKEIWKALPNIRLTLLIGTYAQQYYLGSRMPKTLTETVRQFDKWLPEFLPLPHPSPRNGVWLKRNPWFEQDLIPALREHLQRH